VTGVKSLQLRRKTVAAGRGLARASTRLVTNLVTFALGDQSRHLDWVTNLVTFACPGLIRGSIVSKCKWIEPPLDESGPLCLSSRGACHQKRAAKRTGVRATRVAFIAPCHTRSLHRAVLPSAKRLDLAYMQPG